MLSMKQSNKIVVIVSGGFDPLHSGHITYFNAAKLLGDILIVALNSDAWLTRKKGKPFMPLTERSVIIENLSVVDRVIPFNDDDDTALDAINIIKYYYHGCDIIFANGGDRTSTNIPEMVAKDVIFKFGVGGDIKANSSSWILDQWKK